MPTHSPTRFVQIEGDNITKNELPRSVPPLHQQQKKERNTYFYARVYELDNLSLKSHALEGFDDDDCFAEILKDDIVNLGKPILPSTPDILPVVADKAEHEKRLLQLTEATPLHILPVQGKANRRIRMGQQQPEKYHVEEFIHPRLKQAITTSLLRNLSIQNRMNRQTSLSFCGRFSVELDAGPLQCQGVSQVFIEVMFQLPSLPSEGYVMGLLQLVVEASSHARSFVCNYW
ncbi:hypothetical protein Vadar_016749 [Vaccinium darrowii]|uniref:Uncharacterized protein n=1 Tax=Vaccinium darrowii TaxID=229202 RepID=A0ACB7YFB9_9ERIC|nr:hypothetical protein Vadar_016749 [Vaccinium darrowii]